MAPAASISNNWFSTLAIVIQGTSISLVSQRSRITVFAADLYLSETISGKFK